MSRFVPHMIFLQIVISNSTGSCGTSAIDNQVHTITSASECERRAGQERKGRGREKQKKGEESVPLAGDL